MVRFERRLRRRLGRSLYLHSHVPVFQHTLSEHFVLVPVEIMSVNTYVVCKYYTRKPIPDAKFSRKTSIVSD